MGEIDIKEYGELAKRAATALACADAERKNDALGRIADALEQNTADILASNQLDLELCKKNKRADYYIERMTLTEERIEAIAIAVRQIASADDPIGDILGEDTRADGLVLSRVRVPFGVVGVIFESRPNVTIDIAALCIKSGNAVILRGGSDAINTNTKLAELARDAVVEAGLPADCIQLVQSTDRAIVKNMLALDRYIDIMIPRGGTDLIQLVTDNATMPTIAGGAGVCHTFVDADADLDMALKVVLNAKAERHTVCNALDTVLVHERIAHDFLPLLAEKFADAGVAMRVDKRTLTILGPRKKGILVELASDSDFHTEHLALIANIKVVNSLDTALEHIGKVDSRHSEAIITNNRKTANTFLKSVDAAAVFWNASTYFNDGGEFGLGAEVAVSTGKMHARGPVGMRELTTYKWVVRGDGHIRHK